MNSSKTLPSGAAGALRGVSARLPQALALVLLFAAAASGLERVFGPLPGWLEAPVVQVQAVSTAYLAIFVDALPFLLLGALAAGLVAAFPLYEPPAGRISRRPGLPSLAGLLWNGLLGWFLPVGEVGSVVLARSRLRRRGSFPLAVAVLLAAPAVNPVTAASTLAVFGPGRLFWGRLLLSLGMAVLVGWAVSRIPAAALGAPVSTGAPQFLPGPGWRARSRYGLAAAADAFLETGSLLAAGALLPALFRTLWLPADPASLTPPAEGVLQAVVWSMGLAALLSTGSGADAFLALPLQGVLPEGALLAFLVLGPVMDLKNLFLYWKTFGARFAAGLALAVPVLVLLAGLLWNGLFGGG